MINLLPSDVKADYRYARRNVILRRWALTLLIALVGLGVIGTYGLVSMQRSSTSYNSRIAATEAKFKQENYEETQKQVQDISSSFKLVVKVLGQEVLFSELLKQIAATIPPNTNLTGLNISQSQAAIDISANASSYQAATQLQANLSDPRNKIFSKADIISVSCGSNTSNPRYPCTINIRALFSPDNPFLFINSKAARP